MVCVVEAPPYYLFRDQQGQLRGLSTDLLDRLAALVLDFAGGVPFDSLRFRQEALLVFGPERLPNMRRTLRSVLTGLQLTFVEKVLATISIIVLAVTLGLLLAKG